MLLNDDAKKWFESFLSSVVALEGAYPDAGFSYLALRDGDQFRIHHGRLFLATRAVQAPSMVFETVRVRGGRLKLAELKLNVREFAERIVSGKLETPHGVLLFPPSNMAHLVEYMPFHPEGLQSQQRYSVLKIIGEPHRLWQQPDLDWELKAAPTPYESVQELAYELTLGALETHRCTVDLIAFNVAEIVGHLSTIDSEIAKVSILLAGGLNPQLVRLGYRAFHERRAVARSSVDGGAMRWEAHPGGHLGSYQFDVPRRAVVDCIVSYNGAAQGHYFIFDPQFAPNPRRTAYEAFDPGLTALQDLVAKAESKRESRDLENAVAWLIWMLGFSVAQIGTPSRTSDAPDIVGTTPSGNFIVVECTTGLLRADDKLGKLYERTQRIRDRVAGSTLSPITVLPVIVTSQPLSYVTPDVERAEQLGIAVLAREAFAEAINRTLRSPDADQLFAEAVQAVQAAQTRALERVRATTVGG